MAAVAAADFRASYPEFSDKRAYPDALVNRWLAFAASAVANAERWGELLAEAQMLWAAHNIVLGKTAQLEVAAGGTPGTMRGTVNNESVDKVSVGYDTQAATVEGAADLNLTKYGVQYARLANIYGAGPVQVGLPGVCELGGVSSAWPGPINSLFPNDNG